MMKITLLGDSIRQQYSFRVKNLLGSDFDVWEPKENCRFSQYTLRGLFDWAEKMEGSEVVHWNNGHWDVCRLFGRRIKPNSWQWAFSHLAAAVFA